MTRAGADTRGSRVIAYAWGMGVFFALLACGSPPTFAQDNPLSGAWRGSVTDTTSRTSTVRIEIGSTSGSIDLASQACSARLNEMSTAGTATTYSLDVGATESSNIDDCSSAPARIRISPASFSRLQYEAFDASGRSTARGYLHPTSAGQAYKFTYIGEVDLEGIVITKGREKSLESPKYGANILRGPFSLFDNQVKAAHLTHLKRLLDQPREGEWELADYAARRSVDENFVAKLFLALGRHLLELATAADEYRLMKEDADLVRFSVEFSASEKANLIAQAAVPRRHARVRNIFRNLLGGSLREDLLQYLRIDVESADKIVEETVASQAELSVSMNGRMLTAFLEASPTAATDPGIEGLRDRIEESRKTQVAARWQFLRADLETGRNAGEFLNMFALKEYQSAVYKHDALIADLFRYYPIRQETEREGVSPHFEAYLADISRAVHNTRDRSRDGSYPISFELLQAVAESAFSADLYLHAARYASICVRMDPLHEPSWLILARSFYFSEQYREAIVAYERLMDLDGPTLTAEDRRAFGSSHAVLGNYLEAQQVFRGSHGAFPPLCQCR